MADTLFIPPLNPLHFTPDPPPDDSYYGWHHMDDYAFEQTILPGQEQWTEFYQPYQSSDSLTLQVRSNNDVWIVFESVDGLYQSYPFGLTKGRLINDSSGLYIYEIAIVFSTAGIPNGRYSLRMYSASLTARSNKFYIDTKIENSLVVKYKNSGYYCSVFFETGFAPQLRLTGIIPYKIPSGKLTQYENQTLVMTTTNFKPFRVYNFVVGLSISDLYRLPGVPDFFIDKLNSIVGCSSLQIDGRYYAPNTAAKWEEFTEDGYPMRGWAMEMRETTAPDFITTGSFTQVGLIMGNQLGSFGTGSDNGGTTTTTNTNTTVGTYDYTATGGEYVLHTAKLGKVAVGLFRSTNVQLLTSGIPNSSQAVYDSVSGDITLGSPAGPGEYFLFQFQ